MKVVGHEQRQSRLHQRGDEDQFAEANCHPHQDRGQNQAEALADKSLHPTRDQPQVEPELCHRGSDVQIVAGSLEET